MASNRRKVTVKDQQVPARKAKGVKGGGATGGAGAGKIKFNEFTIKKTHHLPHTLQREALASKLADHSHFRQLIHGVQPTVAFVLRFDDAALVPPLQLPRSDAGQGDDIA